MYDVNYDEFDPVEPADGGTYSTATPERKRHVGLAIGMSLLAVVLCGVITVVNLFTVRIERGEGSTSVIITQRAAEIAVSQALEAQSADSVPEPAAEVRRPQPETEAPMQDLYERLQSGVVRVVPDDTVSDNPYATGSGACTGIVLTSDGYIITCYHSIAQSGAVKVALPDGTVYVAAKVGLDSLTDLAVLKIDAEGLTCADFGDSDRLSVGERVLSLSEGEDTGLGSVMTDGIVCAMAKDMDFNGRPISVLQTNACPRSGSYGAPIVNMNGEVVGIRVRTIGTLREAVDLSLAVPIGSARNIADELIEKGFIPGQPTLSFKELVIPTTARSYYGLPPGAIVESVEPGGAAERAGIVAGDVIVGINGVQVASFEELDSIVKNSYKAGDTVTVQIYRATLSREVKEFALELTLDEISR